MMDLKRAPYRYRRQHGQNHLRVRLCELAEAPGEDSQEGRCKAAVARRSLTAAPRVGRTVRAHQADRVVAQARQHGQYQMPEQEVQAKQAVTWARDHVFERSAVQDRRAILETALVRGMGETTYAQVRHEFEH